MSGKCHRKQKRQAAGLKTADGLQSRTDPALHFVPNIKAVSTDLSLSDDAPVASTAYVGPWTNETLGVIVLGLQMSFSESITLIKAAVGYLSFHIDV